LVSVQQLAAAALLMMIFVALKKISNQNFFMTQSFKRPITQFICSNPAASEFC